MMNFIDILITITINLLVLMLYHFEISSSLKADDCCLPVDDKFSKNLKNTIDLLTKNDKLVLDQQIDVFNFIKKFDDSIIQLKKDIEVLQKSDAQTNEIVLKFAAELDKDLDPQLLFAKLAEYYKLKTGKDMFSRKEYSDLMRVKKVAEVDTNLTNEDRK
jgi:hypothetical protein